MDPDQEMILRWDRHHRTIIAGFEDLLENELLMDCTLEAEGRFVKAHKVILSACSPFLADLLAQRLDDHPVLILKDIKFRELRTIMDYMYHGEVNVPSSQMSELFETAKCLKIKGLCPDISSQTRFQQHVQGVASTQQLQPPAPLGEASGSRDKNESTAKVCDSDQSGSQGSSSRPNQQKRKKNHK